MSFDYQQQLEKALETIKKDNISDVCASIIDSCIGTYRCDDQEKSILNDQGKLDRIKNVILLSSLYIQVTEEKNLVYILSSSDTNIERVK
ncbi:hypothetical protein [Wolbachia endosymbiont of Pentidionis agamae]|uniref:hypothetical protein n=1 Tax=Wolbachia endosymbiont of Pentidionis agamae TaxID=3110435 RepID=UPI002FD1D72D